MKLFTPSTSHTLPDLTLTAGVPYVVFDTNIPEFAALDVAGTVEEVPEFADALPPRSICIVRPGGFGDLLFLTPVLRALRERYPGARVTVACFDRFAGVLEGFCPTARYPMSLSTFYMYDQRIVLEETVEKAPPNEHICDVFARACGLDTPLPDYRMNYKVTDFERSAAEARFFNPTGRTRIGIQMQASSPLRTYPMELMHKVIWLLVQKVRAEVFLFGAPKAMDLGPTPPGITNLMMAEPPLSFRESVAVLATCDAVIAPDSALAHVAAALEIPCVALYGSFPWRSRVKAPTTYALTGHALCAPCSIHGERFPAGQPCASSGKCTALQDITPERIVAKVRKLLQK
jgi:ADP-heptose:LPS heptosyltransferase